MSSTTTSAGMRPATQSELDHAAWTVETLRSVWERQRGHVSERIGVVERAIVALGEDRLDAQFRGEAERAAHMLAGSVGMFGFVDASDAARELESELLQVTPDRRTMLMLVERLREGVTGQVALCTDVAADQRPYEDAVHRHVR
jgi:HPt (histidine-containing phosphotransfer) domain-containing protein